MSAGLRFEHLLNRMERAGQAENPAERAYGAKREAVLRYVRGLEAIRDQLLTLQLAAQSTMIRSDDDSPNVGGAS